MTCRRCSKAERRMREREEHQDDILERLRDQVRVLKAQIREAGVVVHRAKTVVVLTTGLWEHHVLEWGDDFRVGIEGKEAVYVLHFPDGRVYVGRSHSVPRRMAGHAQCRDYEEWGSYSKWELRICYMASHHDAEAFERVMIDQLWDVCWNRTRPKMPQRFARERQLEGC